MAEERWKGKQQEKKLEALQDALLNEQVMKLSLIIISNTNTEAIEFQRLRDFYFVEEVRTHLLN